MMNRFLSLLFALLLILQMTATNAQENAETTSAPIYVPTFSDRLSPNQLNVIAEAQAASMECPDFQGNYSFPNTPMTIFYSVHEDGQGQGFLKVSVVAETTGWLAVGFSPNGRMIGSTAVIGLPDQEVSLSNPGLYGMSSQFVSGVSLMDDASQTIFDKSLSQNDTHTTLSFSKLFMEDDDNTVNIDPQGSNFILVASGFENALGVHPYRASAEIPLEPCTAAITSGGNTLSVSEIVTDNKEAMFRAHGYLAALAWGILAPLAIGAPLNRHLLPAATPLWLQLHQALNALVVICTTASFSLVVKAISDTGGQHLFDAPREGVNGKHMVVGLFIFILTVLQSLGGFFRPHLPHKDDDGNFTEDISTLRKFWQVGHRVLGLALLAMAWYNCHSGLELYAVRFVADETYTSVFWAVALSLWGLIWLGHLSKYVLPSLSKQQQQQQQQQKERKTVDATYSSHDNYNQ